MKKFSLLVSLSLLLQIANAQTARYLIKNDGTRIETYPTPIFLSGFGLTAEELRYFDKKGNSYSIHQSEVKEVVTTSDYWGPEYYISLPITKKYNRLLKVIATNDQYILSVYSFQSSQYLYVHNKLTKEVVTSKTRYLDEDTDYSDILKTIKQYFPDCDDLYTKMEANSSTQRNEKKIMRKGPFDRISNISCEQK